MGAALSNPNSPNDRDDDDVTGILLPDLVLVIGTVVWPGQQLLPPSPRVGGVGLSCSVVLDDREVGLVEGFPSGPIPLLPRYADSQMALRFYFAEHGSLAPVADASRSEIVITLSDLIHFGAPLMASVLLGLPGLGEPGGPMASGSLLQCLASARTPQAPKVALRIFTPAPPAGVARLLPVESAALQPDIAKGLSDWYAHGPSSEKQVRGAIASLNELSGTVLALQKALFNMMGSVDGPASSMALWCCDPGPGSDGFMDIFTAPGDDAGKTGCIIREGEVFGATEEWRGKDGLLFLRLADGRGWVPERFPGGNAQCMRRTASKTAEASPRLVPTLPGLRPDNRPLSAPHAEPDDEAGLDDAVKMPSMLLVVEAVLWRGASQSPGSRASCSSSQGTPGTPDSPGPGAKQLMCSATVDGRTMGRFVEFPCEPSYIAPESGTLTLSIGFARFAPTGLPSEEAPLVQIVIGLHELAQFGAPLFTSLFLGFPMRSDTGGPVPRVGLKRAIALARDPESPKVLVTLFTPAPHHSASGHFAREGSRLQPDIEGVLNGDSGSCIGGRRSGSTSSREQVQGLLRATAEMLGMSHPLQSALVALSAPSPSVALLWRYIPRSGFDIELRTGPSLDAVGTGEALLPGEVFCVDQERRGMDEILYLRLADGRGWIFNRMPGVGVLCVRHEVPRNRDERERLMRMRRALGSGAESIRRDPVGETGATAHIMTSQDAQQELWKQLGRAKELQQELTSELDAVSAELDGWRAHGEARRFLSAPVLRPASPNGEPCAGFSTPPRSMPRVAGGASPRASPRQLQTWPGCSPMPFA